MSSDCNYRLGPGDTCRLELQTWPRWQFKRRPVAEIDRTPPNMSDKEQDEVKTKRARKESAAPKAVRIDDQQMAALRDDICNSLKQSLHDMIPPDFFTVTDHDNNLIRADIKALSNRVEALSASIADKSQRPDELRTVLDQADL